MRAQTGALANEAFLRSFPIPFFKEGFPFLQRDGLVAEEVRDPDQDAVSDSHSGSRSPSSLGDATRVLSEVTVLLMSSRMSSLHEQASSPGIPCACFPGTSCPGTFMIPWTVG